MIDSLLEGTDLTGNITQAVDVILCPDVSFLQVRKLQVIEEINIRFFNGKGTLRLFKLELY